MILNDYDYDVLPREFKRSEKTAGALQLVPYHSPIVPSATRCYLAAPCSLLLAPKVLLGEHFPQHETAG
jgi:hypothetical protein